MSTKWSMSVFESWRTVCRENGDDIPPLEQCDVNIHLSRYVVEARKQNGSFYPTESLFNVTCGLLRKLRDFEIYDHNFLDETNPSFARFREVLDAQMKKLTREGLGVSRREAKPFSEDDEKTIWSKGVFGNRSSVTVQHTMFFYNCKLFGLRGVDEHRELDCNQFSIGNDENGKYIEFKGTACKTYKGGLKHRRIDPKYIKQYDGSSCIVDCYEQYKKALGNTGPFYRRPLNGSVPRYSEQVVGVNKLNTFMKNICSFAGLERRYTNHSGKKTCATTLYQAGIPEQEISNRTGHRSTTALRRYQKPSAFILRDVSSKLNPPVVQDIKPKGETVTGPACTTFENYKTANPKETDCKPRLGSESNGVDSRFKDFFSAKKFIQWMYLSILGLVFMHFHCYILGTNVRQTLCELFNNVKINFVRSCFISAPVQPVKKLN